MTRAIMRQLAIVVLAAGKGTRMKSALPKVLHRAAGRSLLGHVLEAVKPCKPARTVVVVGPEMEAATEEVLRHLADARITLQEQQRGTADAVATAKSALEGFSGTVLVVYADAPLIRSQTITALAAAVSAKAPMAVLGFKAADPAGYGRLIRNARGHIIAIREELDATPRERKIDLCNSGLIAIDAALLWTLLPKIGNANAKKEFYLTDLAELVTKAKRPVALVECPEAEVAGVNDRVQLAAIEAAFQDRYRRQHMLNGATLIAPETVFFSAGTKIGKDVVIEPHVVFGPGVRVGDDVTILAFSHIEGAAIARGARIGPYARLRPGAEIGADANIGNFVEVKQAKIGAGAKANHLTYIGDATVGAGSNIGAGTITCNYDGFEKHRTEIGANVFVGSNTALVAPVRVGDGANIAAGTVVTADVPADGLAIARSEMQIRPGWAAKYREIKKARKAAKALGLKE
ncbi:MAG: bifunctional UDP-N-acetylglucosamine diphosphorylase/glucosamine-1-phosphate N-acetyltransferase GlmU [Hyphomicrobiales bacterium]